MAGLAPVTIYDTIELVQIVPNLKIAQKWLLDTFFPNIVEADTEEVAIDVDIGKRRISPFVSPLVEGRLVETRRIQTNLFKPAYIKDKRAPDLRRPVRRMIGERIGGDMSAMERYEANLAFEMADQIDMINRTLEWMAAQALTTGTVTITGDGFPSTLIDFGRDPALTVTLSGAAQWGQSTTLPSVGIEDWAHLILKKSGALATDIVFTTTPWTLFIQDQNVKDALWFPRAGDSNTINLGAQIQRGAQFKGVWGSYNLWVYNDWYVDPNNVEQPMIPDGTVIMAGPDLMGTRAFGLIYDPEFSYGALAYAPKMWVEKDPAQTYLMIQSAPLVIPSRVNACLAATVCGAVVN